MDPNTLQKINNWLEGDYATEVKDEIRRMQSENPSELDDAFYKNMEFGT